MPWWFTVLGLCIQQCSNNGLWAGCWQSIIEYWQLYIPVCAWHCMHVLAYTQPCMYVQCIYWYVLVYTMLNCKLWFWKDMIAGKDLMCLGDVHSNAPTIVYGLGAVKLLLSTDSCTYLYVHACTGIYTAMHVCTVYILVCTCMYHVSLRL